MSQQTLVKIAEDKQSKPADRPERKLGSESPFLHDQQRAVLALQNAAGNQAVSQLLRAKQPGEILRNSTAAPTIQNVPRLQTPAVGNRLQRKCACGKPTTAGGECEECSKKKLAGRQIQRFLGQPTEQAATMPASVDRVLASPGSPLDPALRQDMEQRFDHDFSRVRVHSGRVAAQSAREVAARAYTVGDHIVFGANEFTPHSVEGRHLLAHELAHVVQAVGSQGRAQMIDKGPSDPLEREAESAATAVLADRPAHIVTRGALRLHRQSIVDEPAAGCGTCLSPTLVGSLVHDLVQAAFPITYQNEARFTIPSSGGDAILDLLHVTLSPDNPPSTVEVGEIKPNNIDGIKAGAKDLAFYMSELRTLFPKPQWEVVPMSLPPPTLVTPFHDGVSPLCPVQAISVINSGGLYLYSCTPARSMIPTTCCVPPPLPKKQDVKEKDDVKEKAKEKNDDKKPTKPPVDIPVPSPAAARDIGLVVVTITGLALLAKFAGRRVMGPAMALAAIVLLANGAEASVGLEGDDPLEALFKLSEAKGQSIPDDIKDALRKDPEMRKLLSNAVKSGNYTAAQQQAGEAVTRAILANRDAFTQEELEILLKATEGNKGSLPQGDITVEELKKQIERKKKGGGIGSGTPGPAGKEPGDGKTVQPGEGGTPALSTSAKTPEERLVEGMASGPGGGPKLTPALKQKLLATARAATPPLTDKEVDELLTRLGSAEGKSEEEIVESVRQGVTALRMGKGGEAGPDAPQPDETGKKPVETDKKSDETPGKVATDDVVKKAKQGKKDPKSAALLEEKLGWVQAGDTFTTGPKDIVFKDGKSFSGSVVGRDNAGNLFFGSGRMTPRRVDGAWYIEVPAGIKLTGAAGHYGVTVKFSAPALPGVGMGKKEQSPDE